MKQYPLGSICIIIEVAPENQQYLRRECTIIGLPGCEGAFPDMYQIEVQGDTGKKWYAKHSGLRLKKFPPEQDAWCREVMKTVLMPLTEPVDA